jgi:hypothetical protein
MSLFNRNKSTVVVDRLTEGTTLAAYALGAFDDVKADLADANGHLSAVKEEAAVEIARHQARHDAAHAQQAQNDHVISKIKELLGEA